MVAVDGSEHSNRALCEAFNLSKLVGGKVTLLHVSPSPSAGLVSSKEQFYAMMKSKGETLLAEGKKLGEAAGVFVETLLLEGDIVNSIAKTAKEGSYDLIVVGARGLSKLEELMLGSVSQGIVKNAPCPVIVTR